MGEDITGLEFEEAAEKGLGILRCARDVYLTEIIELARLEDQFDRGA